MKQHSVAAEMKIDIGTVKGRVPILARALRPVLFHERGGYCCVLGPDLKTGIIGIGPTAEAALMEWNINLKKRLEHGDENDEVRQYVAGVLKLG